MSDEHTEAGGNPETGILKFDPGDITPTIGVTDEALAALGAEYAGLRSTDKKSHDAVCLAARTIKGLRGDVEARRKALKAPALEFGRKVDAEAKRVLSGLKAIEEPLQTERRAYEAIEARRKAEAREAEAKLQRDRMTRIEHYADIAKDNAHGTPGEIKLAIDLLMDLAPLPNEFGPMLERAERAHQSARAHLRDSLEAAIAHEKAEAEKEAQRAEAEAKAARAEAEAAEERAKREALEAEMVELRREKAAREAEEARQKRAAEVEAERQAEAVRIADQLAGAPEVEADPLELTSDMDPETYHATCMARGRRADLESSEHKLADSRSHGTPNNGGGIQVGRDFEPGSRTIELAPVGQGKTAKINAIVDSAIAANPDLVVTHASDEGFYTSDPARGPSPAMKSRAELDEHLAHATKRPDGSDIKTSVIVDGEEIEIEPISQSEVDAILSGEDEIDQLDAIPNDADDVSEGDDEPNATDLAEQFGLEGRCPFAEIIELRKQLETYGACEPVSVVFLDDGSPYGYFSNGEFEYFEDSEGRTIRIVGEITEVDSERQVRVSVLVPTSKINVRR